MFSKPPHQASGRPPDSVTAAAGAPPGGRPSQPPLPSPLTAQPHCVSGFKCSRVCAPTSVLPIHIHVATTAEASQSLNLGQHTENRSQLLSQARAECFSPQGEDLGFGAISSYLLAELMSYVRQDSLFFPNTPALASAAICSCRALRPSDLVCPLKDKQGGGEGLYYSDTMSVAKLKSRLEGHLGG